MVKIIKWFFLNELYTCLLSKRLLSKVILKRTLLTIVDAIYCEMRHQFHREVI